MGKKPSHYAVAEGRIPGIYTSWAETEEQVKGFSDAKYEGFKSWGKAAEWMRKNGFEEFDAEVDGLADEMAALMSSNQTSWLENLREKHGNALVAFCAGSAPRNGLKGGTAAYAVYFPLETPHLRSTPVTGKVTNYRADCEAAEAATTIAKECDPDLDRDLVIYSRCQDLVFAMADHKGQPRWINKWQRNGWENADGHPVEHQDIYVKLLEAETHRRISWHFVDEDNDPRWVNKLHDEAYSEAHHVASSTVA